MKTVDTYNITTFDDTGAPDLLLTGLSTKDCQIWIDKLEAEGVEFYVQLKTKVLEA